MPAYVPRAIALMMAPREMRMHHYLWHTVRDTWLLFEHLHRIQKKKSPTKETPEEKMPRGIFVDGLFAMGTARLDSLLK
jgi:hypothetical protein